MEQQSIGVYFILIFNVFVLPLELLVHVNELTQGATEIISKNLVIAGRNILAFIEAKCIESADHL